MIKKLNYKTTIECELEVLSRKAKSNKFVILLHGFRQTNSWIYKNLVDSIPEDFNIICPNAPFLVPRRNPNLMDKAFAWYFFNEARTEYLIPMDNSIRILTNLINVHTDEQSELYLVGFSQGAYLAPFVAYNFSNTKRCIMLSGRIRTEVLDKKYPFPIDAFHGADDSIINPLRSRDCFNQFIANGNTGSFNIIDNLGHDINQIVREKFSKLLV